MKILEVRDSFVKFESSKKLALSSFVLISGMEKNYIAQIIQIKRAGENDIAYAKISVAVFSPVKHLSVNDPIVTKIPTKPATPKLGINTSTANKVIAKNINK